MFVSLSVVTCRVFFFFFSKEQSLIVACQLLAFLFRMILNKFPCQQDRNLFDANEWKMRRRRVQLFDETNLEIAFIVINQL